VAGQAAGQGGRGHRGNSGEAHPAAPPPPPARACAIRMPLSPPTRRGLRSSARWPWPSVPRSFHPHDHSWPSESMASVLRLPPISGVPGKPRLPRGWGARRGGVKWDLADGGSCLLRGWPPPDADWPAPVSAPHAPLSPMCEPRHLSRGQAGGGRGPAGAAHAVRPAHPPHELQSQQRLHHFGAFAVGHRVQAQLVVLRRAPRKHDGLDGRRARKAGQRAAQRAHGAVRGRARGRARGGAAAGGAGHCLARGGGGRIWQG
jgi:hypothetical protein